MPIYLVRWPDLTVTLVKARDRQELDLILDEVADPGTCKIQRYDGPLFIDFELDVQYEVFETEPPSPLAAVRVEEVSECVDYPTFRLSGFNAEGYEMRQRMVELAFPHYAAYLAEMERRNQENGDRVMCTEAVSQELQHLSESRGNRVLLRLRSVKRSSE